MSKLTIWLREKKILGPKYRPPRGVTIGRHSFGLTRETVYSPSKNAPLKVGSFCSIATDAIIICSEGHSTDCATTYPIHKNLLKEAPPVGNSGKALGVTIGNDVWICQGATIMSGVSIGHGAVIAAKAVVTHDVPPYAIVAGVPAKLVRFRFPKDIIESLLAISWWDWEDDKIKAEASSLTGPIDAFVERHFTPTPELQAASSTR